MLCTDREFAIHARRQRLSVDHIRAIHPFRPIPSCGPALELSGGAAVRLQWSGRCATGRSEGAVGGKGAMSAIKAAGTKGEENHASYRQGFDEQVGIAEREWAWEKPERDGAEREQRGAGDQQQSRFGDLHVQLPFAVGRKQRRGRHSSGRPGAWQRHIDGCCAEYDDIDCGRTSSKILRPVKFFCAECRSPQRIRDAELHVTF